MSDSNIGWIDREKMKTALAALRSSKRSPKRTRKTSTPAEDFVDLFGVQRQDPIAAPDAESTSFVHAPKPTPTDAATQASASKAVPKDAAPELDQPPFDAPAKTTQNEAISPAKRTDNPWIRPVQAPTTSTSYRPTTSTHVVSETVKATDDTARVEREASATRAFLQAGQSSPSASKRPTEDRDAEHAPFGPQSHPFGETFAILRSGPTTPLPRLPEQELGYESAIPELGRSAPARVSHEAPEHEQEEEDEHLSISLPPDELDLSLRDSLISRAAIQPISETMDLSDELTFDEDDFDDLPASEEPDTLEPAVSEESHPPVALAFEHADAPADPHPPYTPPTLPKAPEAPATPAPTPTPAPREALPWDEAPRPHGARSSLEWLGHLRDWIASHSENTALFVGDESGLSLLETSVSDDVIAISVALRQAMANLHKLHNENAPGFTALRHDQQRYLNMLWAPSDHGVISVGIISDEVFPDARLSALSAQLTEAIEQLPLIS